MAPAGKGKSFGRVANGPQLIGLAVGPRDRHSQFVLGIERQRNELFQTVARVSPPAIRSVDLKDSRSQGRGWGHPRYKKTACRPLVPHSPCGTPGRASPTPTSRDCLHPFERRRRLCDLEVATTNSPWELNGSAASFSRL